MSRFVVHKLSKLSCSLKRASPASSLSSHPRLALPLSPLIHRSLSISSSPPRSSAIRYAVVSGHSTSLTARSTQLALPATSIRCAVTLVPTQRRGYRSSSSSSSSSSTHSSIPRCLVFVAPAAAIAYLLSQLDLHSTAYCATLPAVVTPATPSSVSVGSSPRLVTPLAGDDYVVSSWWRRIVAFLIDNSLVSIAFSLADKYLAPFTGPYATVAVPLLSFAFNFTYETACCMYSDGQTLGKWLLGIRVVRDDGQPMDVTTGALLFGGKVLNILLMADVLYGLFNLDRDGKCIHNVVSGTTVVMKVPAETLIQTVQV